MDINWFKPVIIIGYKDHDKEGGVGGGDNDNNDGIPSTDPNKDDQSSGGDGSSGDGDTDDKPSSDSYTKNTKIKTNNPDIITILNRIAEDCMGGMLIGSQKYEVSFSVSTTNSSQSIIATNDYSSGRQTFDITLRNGFTDIDVMEELMHAYLNTDVPGSTRRGTKMNGEIEAKLGWFMYRERMNNMDGVRNYIGFRPGYDQFDALSSCWHTETTNSIEFTTAFREASRLLQVYYKSYANDQFSDVDINIDKLMKLMKDCEKDKNVRQQK